MQEIEIYKNDVPTWISDNSKVYKSMVEDDDENLPFIIDEFLVKSTSKINNIKDFKQIIEIVNYWDIVPFPENLIDYIKINKDNCIHTLFNLSKFVTSRELIELIFTSDYEIKYKVTKNNNKYEVGKGYTFCVDLSFYLNDNIIFEQKILAKKKENLFEKISYALKNNQEILFEDNSYVLQSVKINRNSNTASFLHFQFKNNVLSFQIKSIGGLIDIIDITEISIRITEYNKKNIIKTFEQIFFSL